MIIRTSCWALLIGTVSLTGAEHVFADIYDCAFKSSGKDPYIPDSVQFTVDQQSLSATVYDGLIAKKHGRPIPAQAKRRDSKSIQFNWEVEVEYSRNRTSQADYRVILNHAKMSASMRADVPGNLEPSTGRGRCKVSG